MEKKWLYKKDPDPVIVERLSSEINISTFLATILIQRGIETFDEAKTFFRPSLSLLHDPFLMRNMDIAVNRLTEAVFNREKILIYGDYDVDGTTSVSLVYLFLSQFTENLEYYIPDRYSEGYGISEKGIDHAIDNDFRLIIALDCGIRANERAEQAQFAGVDLIICDHHLPGEKIPKALAVLDPKQPGCDYPFKELSGCGVGFKLLEGFCHQNTIDKEKLFQFLDLVAVSIGCDIVPIVQENRILAYYGLKKLNSAPSAGLKSLIEISGKKNELSITDVVFALGPRINAAGRLTHARESVNLLIGEEGATAAFADKLNERNNARRKFDQSITVEALEMIAKDSPDRKSTVLFKDNWHKGVIGIVASRCIEHFHRPTIILTESNGKATGSARSIDGFDVHEAIAACEDLLEQFGGHTHAAGLTLPLENVEKFKDRFEKVVNERILPDQLVPKIHVDLTLPLEAITFKTVNILNQMAPFGPLNLSPVFASPQVMVDSTPQLIHEKHVKGFVHEADSDRKVAFIGFNMADKLSMMQPGKPFAIAYHLEENNYMGNKSLILNLRDVKIDA